MILKDSYKEAPILNGLILSGGKSVRMGRDKGAIQWHGKEQRYYMADLLKQFCADVYISCRQDQELQIPDTYQMLKDSFTGLGPLGAILSAFQYQPENTWLVVACDLPLVDKETITFLIENRNAASVATTYQSPFDGLPEPLITIWEPKSFPILLSYKEQGYRCPRKVLINSDITLLQPPNTNALLNVNTPEDAHKAGKIIGKTIMV